MSTTLNLPPEVIAVGRLYMRELQRARRGYGLRPVGRPRKVVVNSTGNVENFMPSADTVIEVMESGSR
jgi:hypothetical protein